MGSETTVSILVSALVALFSGGGLVALILAPKRSNQIKADTGLTQAQIEINLSKEARELLEIYREDNAEWRRKTEKAEAKLDFLVSHLRQQRLDIPEWPERLR